MVFMMMVVAMMMMYSLVVGGHVHDDDGGGDGGDADQPSQYAEVGGWATSNGNSRGGNGRRSGEYAPTYLHR